MLQGILFVETTTQNQGVLFTQSIPYAKLKRKKLLICFTMRSSCSSKVISFIRFHQKSKMATKMAAD